MGRTSLGANEGMIFLWNDVADGPVTSEFWMKDTLIPLSIAFGDRTRTDRGIHDMHPARRIRARPTARRSRTSVRSR